MIGVLDGDGILYAAAWVEEKDPSAEGKVLPMMLKTLRKELSREGHELGDIYIGSLNSKKNYRFKYNRQYKANRPAKPESFYRVREQILRLGAKETNPHVETDDIVAIDVSLDEEKFIVSVDKDFNQVPVLRYNWKSGVYSHGDGLYSLCLQLLTGDRTDNIVTDFHRFGPKTAEKYLRSTEEEAGISYMEAVIAFYKNHYSYESIAIERLRDIGQQVYLLRDFDDDFNKLLEQYL